MCIHVFIPMNKTGKYSNNNDNDTLYKILTGSYSFEMFTVISFQHHCYSANLFYWLSYTSMTFNETGSEFFWLCVSGHCLAEILAFLS